MEGRREILPSGKSLRCHLLRMQAYAEKHGRHKMARGFAPAALREMAPTERLSGEPLAYVKLEGLGKIPFSSIRRPKPLMDVASSEASLEEEEDAEEEEPSQVGAHR